ncbi:protein of unknown function [Nitrosotalea devaniterrae]|uniref:Anti-bacteriophage protein A/HamA C-terminal domain-containing protein n=1 Tax=Nitrosotalea devaniterrae TaxID=1078905 RepID=A0A128A200_9ARCH|nr:protein of unknown function [Candidatus Nitrosotalea devanaterra]
MDIQELKNQIAQAQPITEKELKKILEITKEKIDNNLSCRFLMIKTTSDSIRESDFLEFLKTNVVFYVLNYGDYKNQISQKRADEIRNITDLIYRARKKFQRKMRNTGEVGELILFLLLESEGISQVVSKMQLKTSSDWPFFGMDAIHLQVVRDKIIIHYGESKMRKEFGTSLNDAMSSISEFEKNYDDIDEINIVSSFIDKTKFGKFTKEVVKLLNPYTSNKKDLGHSYSLLLCFDWNILQNLSNRGKQELSEHLQKKYEEECKRYSHSISERIKSEESIKDKNFMVYLLPFRDEERFSIKFNEEI